MATIGNTGTPNQTFAYYATNSSNVLAIQVTMPSAGLITAISGYFSGHGATINAQMCVWDSSGTLLAQSSTLSVGSGSGGTSGQSFHTGTVSLNVTNGQVLRIGWWRQANQSDEWTENNGGTEYQATQASNSSASNVTFSSTSGTPSIYATYTPYSTPNITSFSPGAGPAGTLVTINGSNFTGANAVDFNGTSASFSLISDSQITATAPAGVTVGPIHVTNPAGTGASSTNFTPSLIYADDGSAFQTAVIYADDGSNWQLATVWADNGTSWVQIG